MKAAIHALLVLIAITSSFAGEVAVQSFAVNTSYPDSEFLLQQPPSVHGGKEIRIPYMLCGLVMEDQLAKFAVPPKEENPKLTSTTTLPNGGICHVTLLDEQTKDGITELRCKLEIRGPGDQTMETEITHSPGTALILRCDTGTTVKDTHLVLLQIKEKD